jgi:hypothetical protein
VPTAAWGFPTRIGLAGAIHGGHLSGRNATTSIRRGSRMDWEPLRMSYIAKAAIEVERYLETLHAAH